MPTDTISILHLMDQRVTSTFKSYSRNIFHKGIATIGHDSSDASGQSKLKIWKGVTILNATKNIYDSWEEVKISKPNKVWRK